MNEELVKDLREKAEFLTAAEPLGIKNAFAETMMQAADAIEELKFENEILSDGIDDLKAEVKRLEELLAAEPPSLWTDEPIDGTEFMTHSQGGRKGFEIHFRTDSLEKYKAVQEECRRQIGHAKPEPPKEENNG